MFLRAVSDLLAGARHARDLAEVLVTEAVHRTLARVCADYPVDYTKLISTYERDVVTECCALALTTAEAPATCSATGKNGKRCSKKAVLNGVCSTHIQAWQEQQEAQRRLQLDAAKRKRDAPQDRYSAELKQLAKKRQVSMAMPTDVAAVLGSKQQKK